MGRGFEEELIEDDKERSSSQNYKLVPWLNWVEWDLVRDSLFSSSLDSVALALQRVSAWRSRGCLPVMIEVTASIVEIQQQDPLFRRDIHTQDSHSEEMLAMLYCMAIMRLVNCVVEKTRKKTEVSIGEAADVIGLPRMLIDIRHEGSHRELPSLRLVRRGAIKALDWLKSYYWDPQNEAIPFRGYGIADIREEIKSKLFELVCYLKVQTAKGKSGKQREMLLGCDKFLSVMSSKFHPANLGGSKKQISKSLKSLVRLYSSFSSEVVSTLLEFLLKAMESSDFVPESNIISPDIHTALDDWKTVITRLSNKEPEFLISLLKAVLGMIRTKDAKIYENGAEHLTSPEHQMVICQIYRLSYLFKWLVERVRDLNPLKYKDSVPETETTSSETNVPKAVLMELLRKCLLVSVPPNKLLVDSALLLSKHMGNSHLMEKLNRLALVELSHTDITDDKLSPISHQSLVKEEEFIQQAAKKLESVKFQPKHKSVKTPDDEGNSNRWVLAKSWNPCPIGMLPTDVGSSGCFPFLDIKNNHGKVPESCKNKEHWEITPCSGKREASTDTQLIDRPSVKKMRETIESCESEPSNVTKLMDTKGCTPEACDVLPETSMKSCVLIGGFLKKVEEEELLAIKSNVRIWCNPY